MWTVVFFAPRVRGHIRGLTRHTETFRIMLQAPRATFEQFTDSVLNLEGTHLSMGPRRSWAAVKNNFFFGSRVSARDRDRDRLRVRDR